MINICGNKETKNPVDTKLNGTERRENNRSKEVKRRLQLLPPTRIEASPGSEVLAE